MKIMENNGTKSLFISLVGKPNAGKSSLLNMLVGSKVSIVSGKPQTTRRRITGIVTQNQTQLVFVDTPGLYKPKNTLGKYMVSEIKNAFSGAEAFIHVVEAGKEITLADEELIKKFIKSKATVILALNKIDTVKNKALIIKNMQDYSHKFDYKTIIPISAKTSEGREDLIKEVQNLAIPSVFFFDEDEFTDQSERMIAAEIIREKMLYLLNDELPHGIAVAIEKFKTRNNGLVDIDAQIYCEKDNHKGIIIGKNGSMLKKVGSMARTELEEMLDCKINLKLWIKVKENWKNRKSFLYNLGYKEDKNVKTN